jgi:hypothetical protein
VGKVVKLKVKEDPRRFLHTVWSDQPEGHFLLRTRDLDGKWRTAWFRNVDSILGFELPTTGVDVYFSPVAFSQARGTRENVLPSKWLFADLDWIKPQEAPITPDVAWETSPGKWQALWAMTHFVEPEEFRHLNRALCHACGADPGTWNTNRLLRVPGTENMKAHRRAA